MVKEKTLGPYLEMFLSNFYKNYLILMLNYSRTAIAKLHLLIFLIDPQLLASVENE